MYCGRGERSRSWEPEAVESRRGCRNGIGQIQGLSWQGLGWQEWQGSNLRPPVLETGALPIELHSYRGSASPPIRAGSSIGDAPFARAKRIATSDRATRPASRPPLPFAGKLEGALPETPCSTWAFCARLQRT